VKLLRRDNSGATYSTQRQSVTDRRTDGRKCLRLMQ